MSKEEHHPQGPPPAYDANPPAPGFNVGPPYPSQANPHLPPSPMPIYPPSHAAQQQQRTANVVIMQPGPTVIVHDHILPPVPTYVTCPSCRENVSTRVTYKAGGKTHMWALLLCLFGCWPCAPLPYCMDSCQNANHYCGNCGSYIGRGF